MKKNIPDRPLPRKVSNCGVPDEVLGAALKRCKGLQYLAAEQCGICAQQMSDRIGMSPYLKAIRDEAVEMRIDVAEINLSDLAEQKNLGALIFFLKTRGKHRGYTEGGPATVDTNTTADVNRMMEQVSDVQSSLRTDTNTSNTS
jgi:hypothetical protein